MVADSPTMDSLMETRRCRWLIKLSAMKVDLQRLATSRNLSRPYLTRHIYKKLGFGGEKRQLKWMTVEIVSIGTES
jgi:AraC-like DNA-binding protein